MFWHHYLSDFCFGNTFLGSALPSLSFGFAPNISLLIVAKPLLSLLSHNFTLPMGINNPYLDLQTDFFR